MVTLIVFFVSSSIMMTLGELSIKDCADIIIALTNLAFVYYVFFYQRRKDSTDREISWFKDLVVIPNIEFLYGTFEKVAEIMSEAKRPMDVSKRIEISSELKRINASFNRKFVSVVNGVNSELAGRIKHNLDNLETELITTTFNQKIDLTLNSSYKTYVEDNIHDALKQIVSEIYNHTAPKSRFK